MVVSRDLAERIVETLADCSTPTRAETVAKIEPLIARALRDAQRNALWRLLGEIGLEFGRLAALPTLGSAPDVIAPSPE